MTYKLYFSIASRIVLLFTFGILFTYIPDELRNFFGDKICDINCNGYDANWDWGVRHYWYAWMMFLLFILSVISLILQIESLIKKYSK